MERRKFGVDLLQLSWSQVVELKAKSDHPILNMTKYRYMSWDDVSEKYYQTSNYQEEGLTLVDYYGFLKINEL